jgi:hypothetical protein
MNRAVKRRSERIYSFLLNLYPIVFRQEFGEEMKYVFSESLMEAHGENGAQAVLAFWGRTIIDAGKSIATQHVENQKGSEWMKPSKTDIVMQNKVFVWIALAAGLILLVPLVAMQFTDEVVWTLLDFIIAGALLFGTGVVIVLAARQTKNRIRRIAIGAVLAAAAIYIWIELAVGIFTNWGS